MSNFIQTALIKMYAECGYFNQAEAVFADLCSAFCANGSRGRRKNRDSDVEGIVPSAGNALSSSASARDDNDSSDLSDNIVCCALQCSTSIIKD